MKNKVRIEENIAYIEIRLKDAVMETMIDLQDLAKVSKYNWFAWYCKKSNTYYARGFAWENGRTKQFYMHRFILSTPADKVVDHRNHNTLDNRRSNIRSVTVAINQQNRRPHVQLGASRVRNVIWDKFANSWKVYFTYNGVRYNVGRFKQMEDAIKARDKKKLELGIGGPQYGPK